MMSALWTGDNFHVFVLGKLSKCDITGTNKYGEWMRSTGTEIFGGRTRATSYKKQKKRQNSTATLTPYTMMEVGSHGVAIEHK